MLVSIFDGESVLQHLPKVTVFMGVPTHYTRLKQQAGLNREVTAGVPRRVFLIDELPRNAMGKVQKNVLRAAYASLYGPRAGR